jgi:hypothetical protein
MAISRMQEPRQLYGLGSIVKKAVRGVKKIVKSPIGKAALGGALMFGIPGTGIGGLFGRAGFGGEAMGLFGKKGIGATFNLGRQALANRFSPANFVMNRDGPVNKASFLSRLNPFGENFDAKTAFLTGGAGLIAAPFIADAMAPEEVEEEVDVMDVGGIRQSAKDYYMGLGGKNLAFMPQKKYVMENFYQPNADGGRVGYANGMMVEDEEEEFIRSGAGQRFRQPKAFLNMGGNAGQAQAEQMLMAEYVKYKNKGGTLSFEQFVKAVMQQQAPEGGGMEQPMAMAADGGRIGYKNAGIVNLMSKLKTGMQNVGGKFKSLFDDADINVSIRDEDVLTDSGLQAQAVGNDVFITPKSNKAIKVIDGLIDEGYDISKAEDGSYTINALDEGALDIIAKKLRLGDKNVDEFMEGLPQYVDEMGSEEQMIYDALRNRKAEGGIMETEEASEMIDMGGMEKDYRNTGGFVEMGGKERADDVPARLSKNEFVFTADAVRNAGGGDIDKGAEVMENLMNNLEQGGEVSEESQGLEGAQAMYDQQQMLQSRMI